jgi:hypothetical protein
MTPLLPPVSGRLWPLTSRARNVQRGIRLPILRTTCVRRMTAKLLIYVASSVYVSPEPRILFHHVFLHSAIATKPRTSDADRI